MLCRSCLSGGVQFVKYSYLTSRVESHGVHLHARRQSRWSRGEVALKRPRSDDPLYPSLRATRAERSSFVILARNCQTDEVKMRSIWCKSDTVMDREARTQSGLL